jgi:hypothetical protein
VKRPEFAPRPKSKPAAKRVRTKVSKPEPRLLEHVRYGQGKLVCVRQLDSGDYVVVVQFADGAERVIRLDQSFWTSDIASLIPAPTKPRRQVREPKPVEAEENGEQDEGDAVGDEDDGEEVEGGDDEGINSETDAANTLLRRSR